MQGHCIADAHEWLLMLTGGCSIPWQWIVAPTHGCSPHGHPRACQQEDSWTLSPAPCQIHCGLLNLIVLPRRDHITTKKSLLCKCPVRLTAGTSSRVEHGVSPSKRQSAHLQVLGAHRCHLPEAPLRLLLQLLSFMGALFHTQSLNTEMGYCQLAQPSAFPGLDFTRSGGEQTHIRGG